MSSDRKAFNRWVRRKSGLHNDLKRLLIKPKANRVTPFSAFVFAKFNESSIESDVPEEHRAEAKTRLAAVHAAVRERINEHFNTASLYATYAGRKHSEPIIEAMKKRLEEIQARSS